MLLSIMPGKECCGLLCWHRNAVFDADITCVMPTLLCCCLSCYHKNAIICCADIRMMLFHADITMLLSVLLTEAMLSIKEAKHTEQLPMSAKSPHGDTASIKSHGSPNTHHPPKSPGKKGKKWRNIRHSHVTDTWKHTLLLSVDFI